MEAGSDDLLKELVESHCPPLDPALFAAIVSDFDLTDPVHVDQLRADLQYLKVSALEQENLPFDPSGTSGLQKAHSPDADAIHSEQGTSLHGNETLPSQTDATSMISFATTSDESATNPFLGGGSKSRAAYTVASDGSLNLFGATHEEKVAHLAEMFSSLSHLTIQQALKKHGDDISRSMDVLLNLSLFNESTDSDGSSFTLPRGIDGFLQEEHDALTRKKGKKSRKRRQLKDGHRDSTANYTPADAATPNKWEAGQKDIEFICSRTSATLQRDRVSSAYHANGMSLAATIRSLAVSNAPKAEHEIHEDAVMAIQVAELAQEFPTVTSTTLAGLLIITQNAISAANELAAQMTSQPVPPTPLSEIIRFNAPPVDLESEDAPAERRKSTSTTTLSYDQACASASADFTAGQEAFAQASQAYRRGTSDPLMRQAAAYYRDVGSQHIGKAKEHTSAASDAIVASQSTDSVIDLHHVPVQDAVRIARERVTIWWETLGDSKYMHGAGLQVHGGLRIITGLGRHSRDGTSRLGPAVRKMLEQEGWRVQDCGGHLIVLGLRRR